MTRRLFIILGLTFLGGSLLGLLAFPSFNSVLKSILQKDLKFLKIEPEEIQKFIDDADKKDFWKRNYYDSKKMLFIRIYYVLNNRLISIPYQFKYFQLKEKIVGEFLLSTSFFRNRMDESKPVKYMGLYNPYLMPCSNPFSNLYYPN